MSAVADVISSLDARWTACIVRAVEQLEQLPALASRRLRSASAPQPCVDFVAALQIDSPLLLSFAFSCILVQAFLPSSVKYAYFAVGEQPEFSVRGLIQVFGQVLGHGSWSHLQGNLVLLLLSGPAVESAFGAARLSKLFAWVALASSLSHMLLGPANSVQLGASGVVFALILLNSLLQREKDRVPLTFICTAVAWLVGEIIHPQGDRTAHSAHLVGAAVGTWFGHKIHVRTTWWRGRHHKIKD